MGEIIRTTDAGDLESFVDPQFSEAELPVARAILAMKVVYGINARLGGIAMKYSTSGVGLTVVASLVETSDQAITIMGKQIQSLSQGLGISEERYERIKRYIYERETKT